MKNGILYSLITAILFVTLEPVSKLIAGDISPYAITLWRFVIGCIILLPFAIKKIKKEKIHIGFKDIGVMTLLGILFICISMITLQIGVKKADEPSLIAIIFSSNSVFTVLFSALIFKEKITVHKICALVFGTLGVLICVDFSRSTNSQSIIYGLVAALTFSLYTVMGRKYTNKLGGVVQTSMAFLTGSIVLFFVLPVMKVPIVPKFTFNSFGILMYLGIFVTGIGYACYFKAIEKGGTIMGSLAFFIKPVLTPFVTLAINGTTPDVKTFVAVAFIVAASYFSVYKK